ncbi:zinc-ribbon domain-containing protein [Rhodopila sp.]|jgi:predicted Zn finger-like uncharacterized protein|uniref:zinc-ribbon domain-containing protein n=1 Tax=Rhodopila sp. TaxID=2480087 RepID=UPI002CCFCD0C|nr:zinc-ribbon domain-containing protein [Rhodopila sp.]HVZ09856.1 zinc-ribbon domain-containing protein [Rhodopila sp.]
MHLTCPHCAAVYEVPEGSLRPGRRAQCARCGTRWVPAQDETPSPQADAELTLADPQAEEVPAHDPAPQAAAESPAATPPSAPPETAVTVPAATVPAGPTAMDRLVAQAPHTSQVGLRAAWMASILVLAAAVAAAFIWRADITTAWPPAVRVLGGAAASAVEAPRPGIDPPAPASGQAADPRHAGTQPPDSERTGAPRR